MIRFPFYSVEVFNDFEETEFGYRTETDSRTTPLVPPLCSHYFAAKEKPQAKNTQLPITRH